MEGALTSITPAEQLLIAHWIYKTGLMVSTTMDATSAGLPRWHYAALDQSFDLPPASVVWIGRLDQRVYEAALWVQRFQWWDRQLENPPAAEGYVFVLGIGELASVVGVLDTSQSPESSEFVRPWILGSLGVGRLVRVWPSSQHYGHRWPPPDFLSGHDIDGIAAKFADWASRSDAPPETE